MTLRTALTALTLTLGSLVSSSAFAQSAPCQGGAVQPAYAQPVYAQPVYAQPAYGQPVYAQPVAPTVVVQPAAPQPAFAQQNALRMFARGLRMRVAQAERQLRADVMQGVVSPQALQSFAAQQAQLDATLAQAAQDGCVTPQEQATLDQLTAGLENVNAQYRVPVAYNGVAYGHGGMRGRPYGAGFGRGLALGRRWH